MGIEDNNQSPPQQQPYGNQPYFQQPQQQYGAQQPYGAPNQQINPQLYNGTQSPPPQQYYQPQQQQQQQQYGTQQQYYSQQSMPMPPQQQPQYSDQECLINNGSISNEPLLIGSYNLDEPKFQAPKYQDLWFSVLFGVNFAAFLVLCIISFSKSVYVYSSSDYDNGIHTQSGSFAYIFSILPLSVIFGLVYVWLWMRLAKTHAVPLIKYSFIIACALMIGYTIYFFVIGYIYFGILYLIVSIFIVIFYFQFRSRIQFTAALLTSAVKILNDFPSVIRAGYVSMFINFVWFVFFGSTFVRVNMVYGGAAQTLLNIYMVFTMFWVFYVIKNTLHTTASGLFATWYFMSGSDVGMPQNPLIGSARRALTTSFGTICFGSLIISLIETLRYCSQMMMNNRNAIVKIFGYIINFFLGLLGSLVNFFNTYAFTHVAIYGTSFCDASRGTFKLFEDRLGTTLINDNFISWTIYIAGLVAALVLSIICSLISIPFGLDVVGTFLSTLIGYIIIVTALEVVYSGVVTMFVCYLLEPQTLRTTKPELYQIYESAYKLRG